MACQKKIDVQQSVRPKDKFGLDRKSVDLKCKNGFDALAEPDDVYHATTDPSHLVGRDAVAGVLHSSAGSTEVENAVIFCGVREKEGNAYAAGNATTSAHPVTSSSADKMEVETKVESGKESAKVEVTTVPSDYATDATQKHYGDISQHDNAGNLAGTETVGQQDTKNVQHDFDSAVSPASVLNVPTVRTKEAAESTKSWIKRSFGKSGQDGSISKNISGTDNVLPITGNHKREIITVEKGDPVEIDAGISFGINKKSVHSSGTNVFDVVAEWEQTQHIPAHTSVLNAAPVEEYGSKAIPETSLLIPTSQLEVICNDASNLIRDPGKLVNNAAKEQELHRKPCHSSHSSMIGQKAPKYRTITREELELMSVYDI